MSLTLQITNLDQLDNGEPTRLVLDRHGAVIGRSPHADWSLPDPKSHVSSTHCEIDYRDGAYVLTDKSTNGTYLNGAAQRLAAPHVLAAGDEIAIGHYRISVSGAGAAPSAPAPKPEASGWAGWGDAPVRSPFGGPTAEAPAAGWEPTPGAAISGRGPMAQNWAPPRTDAAPPPQQAWGAPQAAWEAPSAPPSATPPSAGPSAWDPPAAQSAPAAPGWGAPTAAASGWADTPSPAAPAAADDVWGRLAAGNAVDWSRGFDAAPVAAAPPPSAPAAAWGEPAPQAPTPAAPPLASQGGEWAMLLAAAGVAPSDLKGSPLEAARAAGDLLKRLVAGLVVMVEARARAKSQLGAQSTTLELNGNNPLKFARSPDRVLTQLLNPPERGFMEADRAIADSFHDLQAHQMATLAAMQGALRATLDRFSPDAIRDRAEMRGVLAKILPGARDAALWAAYEREFDGVAKGSDEAFLDVFAKEFRKAYEDAAAAMKTGR